MQKLITPKAALVVFATMLPLPPQSLAQWTRVAPGVGSNGLGGRTYYQNSDCAEYRAHYAAWLRQRQYASQMAGQLAAMGGYAEDPGPPPAIPSYCR